MYEKVLIPTDGSIGAERGIEAGLDLASRYDATVHTLYVVDERIYGETPGLSDVELRFELLEEQGAELLEEIVEKAEKLGLDATATTRRGMPHDEITSYADENEIDIIVMGRHGASAHPTPHIGSCTDRVVRTASVPVLPA